MIFTFSVLVNLSPFRINVVLCLVILSASSMSVACVQTRCEVIMILTTSRHLLRGRSVLIAVCSGRPLPHFDAWKQWASAPGGRL